MRKNCETCKHDDAEYPSYPHKTPCNECLYGKGCNDAPTKWEAAEHYKPDTNADRIRAMSDEELARHLHCIGWDCHLCAEHIRFDNEPLLRDQKCDENCFEHCLEWLKQPAEGE